MVIADINNPIQRKIRRHKLFLAYLKTAERLHRECGKSIKDAIRLSQEIYYYEHGLNCRQVITELINQTEFYQQLYN